MRYNPRLVFPAGEDVFVADLTIVRELSPGPAAKMSRKILRQIPTHFGRLVYLASLRDSPAGNYTHAPFIEAVGPEVASRTLAVSHHTVFAEWIALPLAGQKSDLIDYFGETRSTLDPRRFRDLPPATAHDVERQLFFTDLETLLDLLRFEQNAGAPIPAASLRP
jgi:hypothetical protein